MWSPTCFKLAFWPPEPFWDSLVWPRKTSPNKFRFTVICANSGSHPSLILVVVERPSSPCDTMCVNIHAVSMFSFFVWVSRRETLLGQINVITWTSALHVSFYDQHFFRKEFDHGFLLMSDMFQLFRITLFIFIPLATQILEWPWVPTTVPGPCQHAFLSLGHIP